jgi:hypothetical protein
VTLQLVEEPGKVASGSFVNGRVRFASSHLDDGNRVERGVELRVGQVFEQPAFRAAKMRTDFVVSMVEMLIPFPVLSTVPAGPRT